MGAELLRHAAHGPGERTRDDGGEKHQSRGPDPAMTEAAEGRKLDVAIAVMHPSALVVYPARDHRGRILHEVAAAELERSGDARVRAELELAAGDRGVAAHRRLDDGLPTRALERPCALSVNRALPV